MNHPLRIETGERGLLDLVTRQLGSLFLFDQARDGAALDAGFAAAVQRTAHCFSFLKGKYFERDGESYFNPFHSGQYSMFLYFLSRAVGEQPGARLLADRVYYLNKALNGVDLFHEVELPAVFFADHPLATVIGRARFSDFFSFTQGCTVGNNNGRYPSFGRNVTLLSGSKVIGDSRIGDDVVIAANAYVKDAEVPSGSIVFGASPNLVIKSLDGSLVHPMPWRLPAASKARFK